MNGDLLCWAALNTPVEQSQRTDTLKADDHHQPAAKATRR